MEVGVFDDAESIAERVSDCSNLDSLAYVGDWFKTCCAQRQEIGKGRFGTLNAPKGLSAAYTWLSLGEQAKLKAAYRETHVEGLIKVGRLAENLGVPGFCGGEVFDRIDCGA